MENRFIRKITIPCYDTDAFGRMKLFAFMNYAQELANEHAELMGFGYETLIQQRVAWILSRMHVRFHQYPHWKDKVIFETWHKGLERLFFLRDFTLKAEDGTALAEATTSWLTLNLDTRKLVRDSSMAREDMAVKVNAVEEPCDKVRMPAGVVPEFVRTHEVVYSDVDFNGHTNNAMYAFWAIDAIGNDFMLEHELKDFYINFNHETKCGDLVSIFRYRTEEDGRPVVCIEGRVDDGPEDPAGGTSSFTVKCIF